MTPQEIIPDHVIEEVHGSANFGGTPKRMVVDQALLKFACGYHNGGTARHILMDHGLVKSGTHTGRTNITKKGLQYLYATFANGAL